MIVKPYHHHSGLQKDVLALYRKLLRAAWRKDNPLPNNNKLTITGSSILSYVRNEFRKQAMSVKRTDFKTIEHMIRKGYKQIKLLQMPGFQMVRGTTTAEENKYIVGAPAPKIMSYFNDDGRQKAVNYRMKPNNNDKKQIGVYRDGRYRNYEFWEREKNSKQMQ